MFKGVFVKTNMPDQIQSRVLDVDLNRGIGFVLLGDSRPIDVRAAVVGFRFRFNLLNLLN
jgi:hypothetical protein